MKYQGTMNELNMARKASWRGGQFLLLDIPLQWQVSAEAVLEVVHKITLDDGTLLAAEANREWRLEHPISTMTLVYQAMTNEFGPPKRDWLQTVFAPTTKESI